MIKLIDSHIHLNADEFRQSWREAVSAATDLGIVSMVNNAGDLASSEWGIEQSNQLDGVYATAGIHPEYFLETTNDIPESHFNNIRRLAEQHQKVVAIGEIGLDYTLDLDKAPIAKQHELLLKQLRIAYELNLPVTLHVRDQPGKTDCFADMFAILNEFTTSKDSSMKRSLTGVFHCWTGTPEQLEKAISLGFYVSFSGIITYKTAGHILDAAKIAPSDKILIETDAPYLTPEPARSSERPSVNEPKYVIMTAEKLANIRSVSLEEIARVTTENTQKLFSLPIID